jgi:hypothetical protein
VELVGKVEVKGQSSFALDASHISMMTGRWDVREGWKEQLCVALWGEQEGASVP